MDLVRSAEVAGLVVGVIFSVILTVALSGVAGAGVVVLAAPGTIVFGGLGWLAGWLIAKRTPRAG